MPEVIFLPEGKSVNTGTGKTLLDLAFENDILIEHNCGGLCACTSCRIIIKDGMDLLEKKSDQENLQLTESGYYGQYHRLSCCCRIIDDSKEKKIVAEIPHSL
jgi:ferredoxin, 2Fe-2S